MQATTVSTWIPGAWQPPAWPSASPPGSHSPECHQSESSKKHKHQISLLLCSRPFNGFPAGLQWSFLSTWLHHLFDLTSCPLPMTDVTPCAGLACSRPTNLVSAVPSISPRRSACFAGPPSEAALQKSHPLRQPYLFKTTTPSFTGISVPCFMSS